MSDRKHVKVETTIAAPIEKVWDCWTMPGHITQWNFATESWHCPAASNDLREGGRFNWRMEARDGSMGFDFLGAYTKVEPNALIEYMLDDGRNVQIDFNEMNGSTHVVERFDPDQSNPVDIQRAGWQAILDNFRKYVESKV